MAREMRPLHPLTLPSMDPNGSPATSHSDGDTVALHVDVAKVSEPEVTLSYIRAVPDAAKFERPPTLQNFVEFGMMQADDEMRFLVKHDSRLRELPGTVGWHQSYGWRLFVHLVDLGNEATQHELLRRCCPAEKLPKVASALTAANHIAVSVSTFVHMGHVLSGKNTATAGKSYEDPDLFVSRCAATGHTNGAMVPVKIFRADFEKATQWVSETGCSRVAPKLLKLDKSAWDPGAVYVPGKHGSVGGVRGGGDGGGGGGGGGGGDAGCGNTSGTGC